MPDASRHVTVRRSGGVAGVTRSWTAAVSGDVSAALEGCGEPPAHGATTSRDDFEWSIDIGNGAPVRVADSLLDASWRRLVDAVRAAADGA